MVQSVIDGRRSLDAALEEYRVRVLAYRRAYRVLRALQWAVQRVPRASLGPLAELGNLPAIRRRWWPRYLDFGKPSAWNGGQPWAP